MVNPRINAQLNLTNDHKKKESPYLACPVPVVTCCMTKMTWVCLSSIAEKRKGCRGFQLCISAQRKKVSPQTAGNGDYRQGEKRKMAGCFTLLRRITRLKMSIQRFKSEDPCHHESRMSHTLAQNCHCEFCCGMRLTCKNTPLTPDRNGSAKRPDKVSRSYLRHSQCRMERLEADPSLRVHSTKPNRSHLTSTGSPWKS